MTCRKQDAFAAPAILASPCPAMRRGSDEIGADRCAQRGLFAVAAQAALDPPYRRFLDRPARAAIGEQTRDDMAERRLMADDHDRRRNAVGPAGGRKNGFDARVRRNRVPRDIDPSTIRPSARCARRGWRGSRRRREDARAAILRTPAPACGLAASAGGRDRSRRCLRPQRDARGSGSWRCLRFSGGRWVSTSMDSAGRVLLLWF